MFDEVKFHSRTEDVVAAMRKCLDEIEDATDAGDYRKCAELWWRISAAGEALEQGCKLAASEKAEEN